MKDKPHTKTIIESHDYESTYLLEIEGLDGIDLSTLEQCVPATGGGDFKGTQIDRRELNRKIREISREAIPFEENPPSEHQEIIDFAEQHMDWSVKRGVNLYDNDFQKAVAWEHESRVYVILWESSQ